MPEFLLISEPPLAGRSHSVGETRLAAKPDLALVSVAVPLGQDEAAQAAIRAGYGTELPVLGRFTRSPQAHAFLIRTAPDQGLIAFEHSEPDAERVVARALGRALYTTDQTDAWVAVTLSGPGSRCALERICPLDLHPSVFGVGSAARTVCEHLGVLILCIEAESYLLLSASSSAESFWHALETSLSWAC